ncbi:MAG: methylated-DNA--[protein]-cysteine S-methyltransferase [Gammaproteobacteria bacterium]
MEFFIDSVSSPIGEVRIIADEECVRAVDFEDYESRMNGLLARHYGEVSLRPKKNPLGASALVKAYFDGDIKAIDAIRVANHGSEFQRKVWSMLREIPAGKTWSYGQLAKAVGKPSASRAVGLANGANPIALVVPCHRVIGADGTLTGYGGGISRKQWLLEHEGAIPRQALSL